jgi:hypothetical protein
MKFALPFTSAPTSATGMGGTKTSGPILFMVRTLSIDRAGRNPGFHLFHGFTGKAEVGILLLTYEDREEFRRDVGYLGGYGSEAVNQLLLLFSTQLATFQGNDGHGNLLSDTAD